MTYPKSLCWRAAESPCEPGLTPKTRFSTINKPSFREELASELHSEIWAGLGHPGNPGKGTAGRGKHVSKAAGYGTSKQAEETV